MKIINSKNSYILAQNTEIADNMIKRIIGLLFRKGFNRSDALILSPCSSTHSFGMNFRFDAIFLDKRNKVVYVVKDMQKNRATPFIRYSKTVIELPVGVIDLASVELGDELIIC